MKTIWILNHYASMSGGRHYKFAENLIKRGYSLKVFRASTVHNINKNLISDSSKMCTYEEVNDIPYVIIRARNYVGNSRRRILNMIDYTRGLLSVSKNFDNEKPNIIYASSVHPLTWLAGYILAKRYKAKFIAETRDLWPETLIAMNIISKSSIPARVLYSLEKFIYKKADKLIFTMCGGKDYIKDRNLDKEIDLGKIHHINNGVDLEEFNNNALLYQIQDDDLLNENFFKIIYAGSLGIPNMVVSILDAAKVLQDMGFKDIKFLIYGSGILEQELKKYARECNLKNVSFKGKVNKKYIPFILRNGHLNIFTGKQTYLYKYGLSLNKMFDYFASGHPIVSNVGCGYDLLEKYKCGITVKGGSAETLAEGILKFYNMAKEEYNVHCKNALKAAQDFDFKMLTDKLEKVLLED
jgi:glycosyltransferase involved in cell wall biosynthesis